MKYNLVTTGEGMMPPGIVVGEIEAKSHEAAVKKVQEMIPGKKMIWDVLRVYGDGTHVTRQNFNT